MVKFVSMSPAEFKIAKNKLIILYSQQDSPFGKCLIAITQSDKAICHLRFVETKFAASLDNLKSEWPGVELVEEDCETEKAAIKAFTNHTDICVLLKGTDFQIKVWKALTQIPKGQTVNYAYVAELIASPKAIRAIAKVAGSNQVAYIIPCHRVIAKSGPSKTCWRTGKRSAMLKYELKQESN